MTDSSEQIDKRSKHTWRDGLLLRKWQTWFGYTSHLKVKLPPLEAVARNLVEHGIAETVYLSDGEAWWNEKSEAISTGRSSRSVGHGRITMTTRGDKRQAAIQFPQGAQGYALEGLFQAAKLR